MMLLAMFTDDVLTCACDEHTSGVLRAGTSRHLNMVLHVCLLRVTPMLLLVWRLSLLLMALIAVQASTCHCQTQTQVTLT